MTPTTRRPVTRVLTAAFAPTLATALALAAVLAPPASADDAKKQQLAQAKREAQLKQCADTYSAALTTCSTLTDAVACYNRADQADLSCRQSLGAAGHSTVPPAQAGLTDPRLRKPAPLPVVKRPLNCSGGPLGPVFCADGHARPPEACVMLVSGVNGGTDRQSQDPFIDAVGLKDTCEGQKPVTCPAGFVQVPRKGQDLCWDSLANEGLYQY